MQATRPGTVATVLVEASEERWSVKLKLKLKIMSKTSYNVELGRRPGPVRPVDQHLGWVGLGWVGLG